MSINRSIADLLRSHSTIPTSLSSTSPVEDTVAKTAAYSVVAGDNNKVILCSAASADYNITLLAAATAGDGFSITIRKTDTTKYRITLVTNSSETISGLPDLRLVQPQASATLISDGSNWHIIDHSSLAVEGNAVDNPCAQVDQMDNAYAVRTNLGDAGNKYFIDRWKIAKSSTPSARYTFSIQTQGGVDGRSRYYKMLCTSGDTFNATNDCQSIKQHLLGHGKQNFMHHNGFFGGGVLSMDVMGHLDTPAAPYTLAIGLHTYDGTGRQYVGNVTIDADATWQRVYLVIPPDTTARLDSHNGNAGVIGIGLCAGDGRFATNNTWENCDANDLSTSSSQNWGHTANNYIAWTNVKFQPGQIATPFVARTTAEETEVARYYFQRITGETVISWNVNIDTTTSGYLMGRLPFPMRATPTMSSTLDHANTLVSANSYIMSSAGSPYIYDNEAFYQGFVLSGATAGYGARVTVKGTNFLQWDANI